MEQRELKDFLEERVIRYNSAEFLDTDPVQVPHLFFKKEDIEISGFFAATLAWGQRVTTVKNALQLISWMDNQPHDFVLNFSEKDLIPFRRFVHRTFNGQDCEYFLWALKNIYQEFPSLEMAFTEGFSSDEKNVRQALIQFRQRFFALQPETRSGKHVSDAGKNSPAKRLNMFLRWMVRKDDRGVDFGIWNNIKPSQLICPLDVHSGRVARRLGLLNRSVNDWKAAEMLTSSLASFDAGDPVKYDFALFGLGIFEKF